MHEQTEKYCIERSQRGDQQAFSWIVDHYKDMVYTLCMRMLGHKEDAEEVAQDVFIKVYRSIKDFQGRSKFSTWIYKITYNQCISAIRKKTKLIDLLDDLPGYVVEEETADVVSELDREDRRKIIHSALEALPETDGFMLTLFYFEELTLEEISEITGMSNNNVRTRLHRARKKLYALLSAQFSEEIKNLM